MTRNNPSLEKKVVLDEKIRELKARISDKSKEIHMHSAEYLKELLVDIDRHERSKYHFEVLLGITGEPCDFYVDSNGYIGGKLGFFPYELNPLLVTRVGRIANSVSNIFNSTQNKVKNPNTEEENKVLLKTTEDKLEVLYLQKKNIEDTEVGTLIDIKNILHDELNFLSSELVSVEEEIRKFEVLIEPYIKDCKLLQIDIAKNKADLDSVCILSEKLKNTDDKNTQRLLGNECKKLFENRNISYVLVKKEKLAQSLKRQILKLESRIDNEYKILNQDIKLLVIDGNNLCNNPDGFIGLKVIIKIINTLGNKFQYMIFFDPGIKGMLKVNDRSLLKRLQKEMPDVSFDMHVMAGNEEADETLLNFAQDKTSYVLSRDRFIDFRDKDAVKDDRVLPVQILKSNVIINRLKFDCKY